MYPAAELVELTTPPARAVPFAASASDQTPVYGRYILAGGSVFASGGAACQIQVIDGDATNGTVVAELQVASGATGTIEVGKYGVHIHNSITIHRIAGTPRGTLLVVPLR